MERSAKADVYARRSCTPPQVVWRLCEIATAILMNSTDADDGCVPWPAQLPQKCLMCGRQPHKSTQETTSDRPGGTCHRAVKRKRLEFSDRADTSTATRGAPSNGAFTNATSVCEVVGTPAARTSQARVLQAQSSSGGTQSDESDFSDATLQTHLQRALCTARSSPDAREGACIA